eukprot:8207333-Lingulodinium_polyedra.AAC.1
MARAALVAGAAEQHVLQTDARVGQKRVFLNGHAILISCTELALVQNSIVHPRIASVPELVERALPENARAAG